MTTTQAAKVIGCDPSSVRRMIRNKTIKQVKKMKYPDGTFAYDVPEEEARRVRDLPKAEKRGYPRGKKRVQS